MSRECNTHTHTHTQCDIHTYVNGCNTYTHNVTNIHMWRQCNLHTCTDAHALTKHRPADLIWVSFFCLSTKALCWFFVVRVLTVVCVAVCCSVLQCVAVCCSEGSLYSPVHIRNHACTHTHTHTYWRAWCNFAKIVQFHVNSVFLRTHITIYE